MRPCPAGIALVTALASRPKLLSRHLPIHQHCFAPSLASTISTILHICTFRPCDGLEPLTMCSAPQGRSQRSRRPRLLVAPARFTMCPIGRLQSVRAQVRAVAGEGLRPFVHHLERTRCRSGLEHYRLKDNTRSVHGDSAPIPSITQRPSARGWTINATTQAHRLVSDRQLGGLHNRGVGLALCPAKENLHRIALD